jgi:sugar/nucleoside kinase (ribokinase family)
MARIAVAGLINVETTVRVDGFPVEYRPQNFPFFGLRTAVSGVGYNIAAALTTLGNEAVILSLIGNDLNGTMVKNVLADECIGREHLLTTMPETPQSVILYDASGRREIFTDLKDIQERAYPIERFAQLAATSDLCVLCNINFARGLLPVARRLGKPIATDVHTIANIDDDFNRDFMAAADILFCSDERLPEPPESWVQSISRRYDPAIQVVGLGAAGALLAERGRPPQLVPAVTTRPVVNTIGAGDSLFAAFLHGWLQTGGDALLALRLATIFASWKVGGNGGADGFLMGEELQRLAATQGILS